MITSITFQFKYNKNYLTKKTGAYGEETTTDLQRHLNEDVELFKTIHAFLERLNSNLSDPDTPKLINEFFPGRRAIVTQKTKTKRTYFVSGLTIHEEDKI